MSLDRWCLRLSCDATGAVRYGDVLYGTRQHAERDALAWNALATGEAAEAACHPTRPVNERGPSRPTRPHRRAA